MKKFEILEHTADLKMKIWGKDLPELFSNAMEGMMYILSATKLVPSEGEGRKRIIKIESADATSLLIDFLNEVLYQSQVNKEIYSNVKFLKFSETSLEAELYGSATSEFNKDIKAATYHQAEIKKTPEGVFEVVVLFDV